MLIVKDINYFFIIKIWMERNYQLMLSYGISIKYKVKNLKNKINKNQKNRLDFLRKCLEMVVKIYNKNKQKYK